MRRIVHISDLHFGRTDERLIHALADAVKGERPSVVAISGDLTQRARAQEFQDARDFLRRLPAPQIVVPGNHDVPLHNPLMRFGAGLLNYKTYITEDMEPFYADDEVAVLGMNTARALTWKGGRINRSQLGCIEEKFCGVHDDKVKVLVTHHPFDLPDTSAGDLVGRARMAMHILANCGVDVLLAGHYHVSSTGCTAIRYQIAGHSAVFVQAGTAISTRGRGEANSFNILEIHSGRLTVRRRVWDSTNLGFEEGCEEEFERTPSGWARVLASAVAENQDRV
jgi:3',5'-cyclic AMP phosphodiesterase CpdA